MRSSIKRTERVAVNIADGYARTTAGKRFIPCVMQYGPGAEAAHAAVSQAFGDGSPILQIPDEHARAAQVHSPTVGPVEAYRPITVWSAAPPVRARHAEVMAQEVIPLVANSAEWRQ